jgi:predicted amidophosphoribosyltransferase
VTTIRALANAVLSALVAPPCAGCGHVLDFPLDGAVCTDCWSAIQIAPSSFALSGIDRARAIGEYDGPLREILHALKYHRRRSVASRLARIMGEHGGDILHGADAVVPVPLHPVRRLQRGFNQADDLARGLARLAGVPVWRVLNRTRHTRPQIDLPADRRRPNVHDAFVVTGWAVAGPRDHARRRAGGDGPGAERTDRLAGRVLVLIDDVTTTGATLEACARALRTAGAREVRALTAARVAGARR